MYYYNSRSPLSEPEPIRFCAFYSPLISCRGEYMRGVFFNSRSPPYEQNLSLFYGLYFDTILGPFFGDQFFYDPRLCGGIHSGHGCHTMYIYSLGHFLTTKGALIDGDWGGQKMTHFPQK